MNTVTPEQALETYKRTVRDEPRESWANWVVAISNSQAVGEWIGGVMFEGYAKEVFEMVKAEKKVSMADENDRP